MNWWALVAVVVLFACLLSAFATGYDRGSRNTFARAVAEATRIISNYERKNL